MMRNFLSGVLCGAAMFLPALIAVVYKSFL